MYKIELRDYGYKLTFAGQIPIEEMTQWLKDSEKILTQHKNEFLVFVDMRTLIPLDQDTQEVMKNGQMLYRESGMKRSVVILNSPVLTMQFKRIAGLSKILEWERYIDASSVTDWEAAGLDWIIKGIEPDSREVKLQSPSKS